MTNEHAVKHGGCFNCGTKRYPILKSLMKAIIDRKGKRDSYAVAVCPECEKIPVIDLSVK